MRKIFLFGTLLFLDFSLSAQINSLGKKILEKVERNPVENLLKEKPPITTSFADVDTTGMLDASFGSDSIYRPLTDLKRTEDGGFILEPGFYQLQVESYCLHAGTHGPSSGYGYMYAPVLGPKADIVTTISKNSIFHPEIAQHDIQLVLWAIIARSKFGDLQPNIKLVATKLLSHQQLLELQGGAIGLIPDALLQKGISSLPSSVQTLMQAENNLRRKLSDANSSYEEMERIAVLAGMAPPETGIDVPSGVWSFHPDGYFIRFFPTSYSSTLVQVFVPPIMVYLVNNERVIVPWGYEPSDAIREMKQGNEQNIASKTDLSRRDAVRSAKHSGGKRLPPHRKEWEKHGKVWKDDDDLPPWPPRWDEVPQAPLYLPHVATPANTGNQRLMMSGRAKKK